MKPKEILVFGATGQIGRHLLRKLAKNNFKVTAVTRNSHTKGYVLKSQANAGWLNIVEIKTFSYEELSKLFKNKDICVNLVGILHETGKTTFNNIHTLLPKKLAQLCKENNLKQFIHISALGLDEALESKYASSKLNGEIEVKKIFKEFVILRPSLVYSIDDNFTTMLFNLLKFIPIFPLYYNGKTAFFPLHVSDMTEIIEKVILKAYKSEIIECIGPEKITFKMIIQKLAKSLNIKRFLLPMPLFVAKIFAKFFEITMKYPLLTTDQLIMLNYDNSPSGKYNTNVDLELNDGLKNFDKEISKYSYMWKAGGEFSKEKISD